MPLRANISLEGSITDYDFSRLLELRNACEDLCARLDVGGCDGAGTGMGQTDFDLELNDRYPNTEDGAVLAQEAIYVACEAAFLGLKYKLPERGGDLTVNVSPEEPEDETPLIQEVAEKPVATVTLITRTPRLTPPQAEILEALRVSLGEMAQGPVSDLDAHVTATFDVTLDGPRWGQWTPTEASDLILADLHKLLGEAALAAQTGWVLEARVDVPHTQESEASGE